ncbi:MAG: sugar phosphate isomerase/epimerase [Paludibacter sp.]|nr:sugar phosphate isomerase/epimerase [Paludibacter sp.]
MNNKKLLIGLTLLFLVLFGSGVFGKPKNKVSARNNDIYIQLYSVRTDIKKDFKATIAELGKMGYKGIEAAGYADGKFYDLTPEQFKKEIENAGMTVLSSHVGKRLNDDISKTDWNEIWQWWDMAIQAHKMAGMKYIVMPSMPKVKTLAELKSYCDYYNQIGDRCNAAGLRFGYHNHSFEFVEIEGEMMYDYMIRNTDPSKVFFQMDVYWVIRGGQSPVEYFKNYPNRFEILHLKDHKELGQSGMVGFDAIFRNAKEAGVKQLVVEVEKYNFTPFESVAMSLDYLLRHPDFKEVFSK